MSRYYDYRVYFGSNVSFNNLEGRKYYNTSQTHRNYSTYDKVDISLLELKEDVEVSEEIKSICLPEQTDEKDYGYVNILSKKAFLENMA